MMRHPQQQRRFMKTSAVCSLLCTVLMIAPNVRPTTAWNSVLRNMPLSLRHDRAATSFHHLPPAAFGYRSNTAHSFRTCTCSRLRSTTSSSSSSATNDDIDAMRAGEIKKELEGYGISTKAFLEKKEMVKALRQARSEGRQPVGASASSASSDAARSTSSTSSSSSSSRTTPKSDSREERLAQEIQKCQAMKPVELKKELEERGISTKSYFEKSEFVQALAAARVDNTSKSNKSDDETADSYAEYANVEVLTDNQSGPRPTYPKTKTKEAGNNSQQSTNPFGAGMGGGAAGMGGIADMLKNMGMGGGMGGNPFGGAAAGMGNPFGGMGGMGDTMGKAQQMMSNPKVQELMRKAQSNPRIMAKMQECMSNPAAMMKYQNDPEVSELVQELKKYM